MASIDDYDGELLETLARNLRARGITAMVDRSQSWAGRASLHLPNGDKVRIQRPGAATQSQTHDFVWGQDGQHRCAVTEGIDRASTIIATMIDEDLIDIVRAEAFAAERHDLEIAAEALQPGPPPWTAETAEEAAALFVHLTRLDETGTWKIRYDPEEDRYHVIPVYEDSGNMPLSLVEDDDE